MIAHQTYAIFAGTEGDTSHEIDALRQIVSLVATYVSNHGFEQTNPEDLWRLSLSYVPFLSQYSRMTSSDNVKNLDSAYAIWATKSSSFAQDKIPALSAKFTDYLKGLSVDNSHAFILLIEAYTIAAAEKAMVKNTSIRLMQINFSSREALINETHSEGISLEIQADDYFFDFRELNWEERMQWDALMKNTGSFPGIDFIITKPE